MAVTYYQDGSIVVGTLEEYLAAIEARYKVLWGETFRTGRGTQSRNHASIKAELMSDLAATLAYVAAQTNPETANGASLHENVAFNGISVNANVYSTVTMRYLAGPEGAEVPAGHLVSDGAGTQFAADSAISVPAGNTLDAPATAVEEGPIEAAAGTLTTIDQPVYGLLSVTNPADAVVGNFQESDPALKARRRDAARGVGGGSTSYVEKRLRDIDNVTDALVRIDTNKHAHIVVEGGTDADIAMTLHRSVGGGTIYEGTTQIAYTDAETDQNDTIRFYRAVTVPVYIVVQVERLPGYANAGGDELVKQRIVEYFTGGLEIEGTYMPRPRLGETITVGKVSLGGDTVDRCFVRRVYIGFNPSPTSDEDLSMNLWQRGTTSADLISVVEYTG